MSDLDIAIVGMAGRFSGALDIDALWSALREGKELISQFDREELLAAGVSPEELDQPGYVGARGVLPDADLFDAEFFGFSPREAEVMDPQHRLFLQCVWESLEVAGYVPSRHAGSVGVFAGVGMNTYLLRNLIPNEALVAAVGDFQVMALNDKDTLASRVSYKLDLRGPSVVVQTSCSTGLVAVNFACDSLNSFGCDMAVAGSVAVKFPQVAGSRFVSGGIVSPDGHCRAFDARAEGTVNGGGVGVVVLKRLADALADGDRIEAVIRGGAVNNDGHRKVSYAAPSVAGQADVIVAALAQSGVHPESIGYVEAHGTGTPIGDPIEIEALSRAFRTSTARTGYCAIGSVKTNLGHLDTAAGMAGLIKAVKVVQTGQIPPSLHYERPNPAIDFGSSPFRVVDRLQPWPAGLHPRRAGVSSFGVGGTNAHVVIEEPPPAPGTAASVDGLPELLVWSARRAESLEQSLDRFQAWKPAVGSTPGVADVAHTLHRGRASFAHRAALVCHEIDDARRALAEPDRPAVLRGIRDGEDAPPVVLMFPGQGTQLVAVGAQLFRHVTPFREAVAHCCEVFHDVLGFDLRTLLYPESDPAAAGERLRQTELTQPAVFVLGWALARTWHSWGLRPAALLGHSLGEYVAACMAGVFSLEDALRTVALRGRLMAEAPSGAMLAIRLPETHAMELVGDIGLSLAAVNGAEAVVMSGPIEAVSEAERRLVAADVPCQRLETSHAFHSPVMQPAAEDLKNALAGVSLRPPTAPVISTVTGDALRPEQACDPAYWGRQVVAPVQFGAAVATACAAYPGATWLECGPGRSLAGLVRQPLDDDPRAVVVSSLPDPGREGDLDALFGAAGRLWVRGHEIDLGSPYDDSPRRRVGLPTYPFARNRYWVESTAPDAARSPAAAAAADKNPDPDAWFVTGTWQRSRTGRRKAREDVVLVLGDDDDLISALGAHVGEMIRVVPGNAVRRLDAHHWSSDPTSATDLRTLLDLLREEGVMPTRVLHAFTSGGDGDVPLRSLVAAGRSLSPSLTGDPVGVWVATRGLFDVLGTEPLEPSGATVLGAARVLQQERPWIRCGVVDLPIGESDPDQTTAADLAAELAREVPEPTVALRTGGRWVRAYVPAGPFPDDGGRVRAGGVGLIVGGLGRFGRLAAEELLGLGYETIAILDPAVPDEALTAQMDAMRARGAQVVVLAVDVADEVELRCAVSGIVADFGGIDGVIHAAGPPELLVALDELDDAAFEAQFAPKVRGLMVLDRVLDELAVRPDFAIVTSSLASVLGGLGHTAYAAASAFADAFALRGGQRNWQSVAFETWLTDGDPTELDGPGDSRLRFAMTAEETSAVLRRILSDDAAGVGELIVSTANLDHRIATWVSPDEMSGPAPRPTTGHGRPKLAVPYVAPRTELEAAVAALWEETLGVIPVGVHDSFFELGGDSLMATRVASGVRSRLGVDLPLRRLFDSPTPAEIAAAVAESQADSDDVAAVEDLLAELDGLPADLVRAQLRQAGLPMSDEGRA